MNRLLGIRTGLRSNAAWIQGLGFAGISFAAMTVTVPALAQTTLPGIVVTSPSPVARPVVRPAPQPAPGPSIAAASDETGPSDANTELSPPPGVLIIADDAFVPVTIVTEREVQARQGATIADTLQLKPGIAGSTFAAGANRPIIRGLDNARVRVQENGIGAHDESTLSEDHAVPIDPNAVERIEVIRGPATLRYGSQAIGGVV